MSLFMLPNELLRIIAVYIQSERDLNAFARTNRRLYELINQILYHYNVKENESSALLWAARHGQITTAQKSLQEGANVESEDSHYRRTPLLWAANNGHDALVKMLLDHGADIDAEDDYYRQTPLSLAAGNGHKAVVQMLLDNGANMELEDNGWGRTPLLWAAGAGHTAVVQLLLDYGANIEAKDDLMLTPLSLATRNGYLAVVAELKKRS